MPLRELHSQHETSISRKIESESTLKGAVDVVVEYLTMLTDLNGDYVAGLTRPQAKIALSILGIYRDQLRNLTGHIDNVYSLPATRLPGLTSSSRSSANKSYRVPDNKSYRVPDNDVLAGIGTSTLVATFLANPLIAITAGSLAGLLAAIALLDKNTPSPPLVDDETSASATPSHCPPLDHAVFMSSLEQLFRIVDDVLEEHHALTEAAHSQPAAPKLEDHTRILEFIQDLLGWYQRRKSKLPDAIGSALQLRLAEQLPDLLSEYGIRISCFPLEATESDMKFFDFEDEVGERRLSKPLMVRPALSKEGGVLLRGRVIEPQPSR